MTTDAATTATRRTPLSRDRILTAAVALADKEGIEALSMRRIGHALGVEAMSLYNHVANKEDILDGMFDVIIGEIDMVTAGSDWRAIIRARAMSAREVLVRHPWAPSVIQSRTTISYAAMKYFEATLAVLFEAGFSEEITHHAIHTLGSRVLGFTQELFDMESAAPAAEEEMMNRLTPEDFPNAVRMLAEITHDKGSVVGNGCDDKVEFEFGLDLVLDGLDQLLQNADA